MVGCVERCRVAAWFSLLWIGLWVAIPVGTASTERPGNSLLAGDGILESFSLGADRGPVHVEAQRLEFDYRTGVLTYTGEVLVRQGDLNLRSDVLRVTLDLNAGRPHEIVAEGNVRISKGERVATGGRAVFDQNRETITLSQNALLQDGPNEVAGERVVVYLREERSVVEGGGGSRVRAVLFPPGAAQDGGAEAPAR